MVLGLPRSQSRSFGSISVTRLRCNGTERPVGDLRFDPRLEWQMVSGERGERQTAYQLSVNSV